jgi:fumarylacetoacetate (FAA) hydrolase
MAEQRAVEEIRFGEARTPFLRYGDHVRIEMIGPDGVSIFGAIEQVVAPYDR